MQFFEYNCWLQYFIFGEILRVSGDLEEATIYFRYVLDFNLVFELVEVYLREIGLSSIFIINIYIFLIIGLFVVVVLVIVYFMTLISESRGIKSSRMSFWLEGKRLKKRFII